MAGNTENVSNKKYRHTRKGRFSPTLCEIINGVCEIINGGFTIANVNNLNKKNSMKLKIEEKSSLFWIMFIGIGGFVILFICGYCVYVGIVYNRNPARDIYVTSN